MLATPVILIWGYQLHDFYFAGATLDLERGIIYSGKVQILFVLTMCTLSYVMTIVSMYFQSIKLFIANLITPFAVFLSTGLLTFEPNNQQFSIIKAYLSPIICLFIFYICMRNSLRLNWLFDYKKRSYIFLFNLWLGFIPITSCITVLIYSGYSALPKGRFAFFTVFGLFYQAAFISLLITAYFAFFYFIYIAISKIIKRHQPSQPS